MDKKLCPICKEKESEIEIITEESEKIVLCKSCYEKIYKKVSTVK